MEYQPGLPEHNDNVSHQRPGREFVTLMLAAVVLILIVVWLSGLAVDWAVAQIDPKTERALLEQFSETIELDPETELGPETNSAKQKQLQALLDPLLTCVDQPYQIKLLVKEDEAVNAFAVPGGQMWVTTGLLHSGLSENALSFVLGHELGHFANRDHLRGLGRGLVLWVVSRSMFGGNSGISQLLSPSMLLGQAQHSQGQESDSDVVGLNALQCRYGHVGGATEFFEKLQLNSSSNLPGLHYFESHPQLQQRIDNLRQLASQLGFTESTVRQMP